MAGLSARGEDTDPAKTRVFLLEDHAMMREGLRRVLSAELDIEVVGDAGTVASALGQLPELRPDVAILDVRLREGDGVSACRDIRSMLPDTACLMYTAYDDDQVLLSAILVGAAGYVMKDAGVPELVNAVRIVATGQSILDPQATHRVMAQLRQGTPSHDRLARNDRLASLTAQEQRVLDLIGEGLTNRQIADRMFLAEKTAKNYVSSLLAKLGLERRSQAAVVAVQQPKVPQS
jgi:two-component system, NarL family, response regulator DevR